ncbi:MAG: hypothetical protein H6Q30_93 [Bacteroidetes bacterium]|nr:hypothetical protein [Bacteroidota bacterium]
MKFILFTALFVVPICAWAQSLPDTSYQVELTITPSPMFNFFRLPRVPGTSSKTSLGYGISIRALWHPGRLLSVGLLSGYFVMAEDELSSDQPSGELNYQARLAAVPLLLALTMQKYNVEIGMGVGPYIMMTSLQGGHSASVHSSRLELGMTFFGAYMFSLGDNVFLGPELRVVSFRYRGIISIMPSCSFRVIPLRY